jgi:hypothetical protein
VNPAASTALASLALEVFFALVAGGGEEDLLVGVLVLVVLVVVVVVVAVVAVVSLVPVVGREGVVARCLAGEAPLGIGLTGEVPLEGGGGGFSPPPPPPDVRGGEVEARGVGRLVVPVPVPDDDDDDDDALFSLLSMEEDDEEEEEDDDGIGAAVDEMFSNNELS